MATRVADMSVDELKVLIQETVTEALTEMFSDPDDGLALRDDIESALHLSLGSIKAGGETIAAENVAGRLGLSW